MVIMKHVVFTSRLHYLLYPITTLFINSLRDINKCNITTNPKRNILEAYANNNIINYITGLIKEYPNKTNPI